jgi:hypothetical protein
MGERTGKRPAHGAAGGRRDHARMRILRAWPWLLLAACALTIAALALAAGAPEPPPAERTVERRLRSVSARGGFPLHEVQCVRDRLLPRTFVCLVEGPDDMHLAWEVRWLPDGGLAVRRPDGSRIRF